MKLECFDYKVVVYLLAKLLDGKVVPTAFALKSLSVLYNAAFYCFFTFTLWALFCVNDIRIC